MTDPRQAIEALPASFDLVVDDAMVGAADSGFDEGSDPEGFWAEVLGRALAEGSARGL